MASCPGGVYLVKNVRGVWRGKESGGKVDEWVFCCDFEGWMVG